MGPAAGLVPVCWAVTSHQAALDRASHAEDPAWDLDPATAAPSPRFQPEISEAAAGHPQSVAPRSPAGLVVPGEPSADMGLHREADGTRPWAAEAPGSGSRVPQTAKDPETVRRLSPRSHPPPAGSSNGSSRIAVAVKAPVAPGRPTHSRGHQAVVVAFSRSSAAGFRSRPSLASSSARVSSAARAWASRPLPPHPSRSSASGVR